ncbi:MAG: hypothetical protein B7Z38_04280 [Rhodobacterales bacterium 12-64-8]|nr:MAG: hypothetical protein B7Z38_04280 [Rhodobacterales bacterium 12-64-8]OYX46499.1 MAG: hypothetical protein B7Y90_15585 [Alphaproteobacteria bacterium 32-64-14]
MRFTRREIVIAASLTAVLAPSASAFAPPAAEPAHGNETPSEAEVARSLELGGLVFPVFDDKLKLKNYLFISARMLAGPGKDVWKYREQQHFIRDGILRAAHKTSFHAKGNLKKLDETLAAAECLKVANQIVGEAGALVQMTFTQIASQS